MALADIPAKRFPLRFEAYSKIYDQLSKAAVGFDRAGYPDLARKLEDTVSSLYAAWNAITEAERLGR